MYLLCTLNLVDLHNSANLSTSTVRQTPLVTIVVLST